jgi:hypothetical protein
MAQDNMNFNRRRSFGNIPQYGLVKGTVAPGFVDYGQVLRENIDIDDIIKARKLKEDEYAENIANSPADIDVAKVPDAYEAGLTDYLTELKMEYSEGAKLLRDNRVGSDAYKRGQELVRNSKGFMANLDKEYSALQSASLEDIKNIQQDMYSSGNDESNQINTGSMLLKGQLSPDKIYYQDGKMYIRGGGDDGKDIAFSDLRLRFLKDSASMGAMTTSYRGLVDNAIKSGRRFNDVTDGALINDILTKANSQGIRSIAYDYNFPIPGDVVSYAKSDRAQKIAETKFNGDKNWIRDINNSDILRNDMLSYFNDVFKTAINTEADAYDTRQKDILAADLAKIEARKTDRTGTPKLADLRYKAYETILSDVDTIMSQKEGFGNVGSPEYTREFMEELGSKAGAGGKLALKTEEATLTDIFGSKEKSSSIKGNIESRLSDREDFSSAEINLFNNILFDYSKDKLQGLMNKNSITSLIELVPGSSPKTYRTTAKMDSIIEELDLDDAYEGGLESIKTTKFNNAEGLRRALQRMILHSSTKGSTVDNPSHVFKYVLDIKGNLTVTGVPGIPTDVNKRSEFINNMIIAEILPNKVAETIGAGAYNYTR